MDLTIAILIYDEKGYESYVKNLLSSIKRNLKNYKTLLFVDDRKDQNVNLNEIFNLDDFSYIIVKHGKNLGVLQGYLTAIKNSTTEWIWILDQDDLVSKFDFSTIKDINRDVEYIYFKNQIKTENINYENLLQIEKQNSISNYEYSVFDYDRMYSMLPPKYSKAVKITNTQKINEINIVTNYEKEIFYSCYETIFPQIWAKILNVNFAKRNIMAYDFDKFGNLYYAADNVLSLFLYDKLKKFVIINDTLPYLHDQRNMYKYTAIINGKYNQNIKDDVLKSWGKIYHNLTNLHNSRLLQLWFNNLKFGYEGCKLNFEKYGLI